MFNIDRYIMFLHVFEICDFNINVTGKVRNSVIMCIVYTQVYFPKVRTHNIINNSNGFLKKRFNFKYLIK